MKTQHAAMFAIVAIAAGTGGIFSGFSVSADNSEAYSESGNIMGHITMVVTDENGNIKDYIQTDNLVVDEGIDTMGDLIFPDINLNSNGTDGKFDWVGIGTGATGAAAGNTGEETVIATCQRVQDGTVTGVSTVSGEITVTVDASFSGSVCTGAITEAVLTNSGTGTSADAGELLARQTFSAVNVGASDTLTVSWEITLT